MLQACFVQASVLIMRYSVERIKQRVRKDGAWRCEQQGLMVNQIGMFAIGLPIESRWEAGAARTWLQAAVFRLLEVPVMVCRKRATLGRRNTSSWPASMHGCTATAHESKYIEYIPASPQEPHMSEKLEIAKREGYIGKMAIGCRVMSPTSTIRA